VPPSFFREFLNVSTLPLTEIGGRNQEAVENIRAQWDDLLSLPLVVVPLQEIIHHSGVLVFDENCPAPDSWYIASAAHASATLWMSHEHSDGLAQAARRHVEVRLLSEQSPNY